MGHRVLAGAIVLDVLAATAWGQVPRGPEFHVNTYTTSEQHEPAVAVDAAGRFVVTWDGIGPDGTASGSEIYTRRYDALGSPIDASEFRVNAYTTESQARPSVAAALDGSLVFVWDDFAREGSWGVYGQRFDAGGTPTGGDFHANTYTTDQQLWSAIASDAAGNFVVVWTTLTQVGDQWSDVFGQRFDASGVPQGPEFRVNTTTFQNQRLPAVAAAASGSFVVVWAAEDDFGGGIFGQRFDAAGTASGPEFRVNEHTTTQQYGVAVAADAAGNFVVVWENHFFGIQSTEIFARRYDVSGVPIAGEFRVNAYTTFTQDAPAVASDPFGNFVVAWQGDGVGDLNGVFARWFDKSGAAGDEFRVHVGTTGSQAHPALAADPRGNFVVTWSADSLFDAAYDGDEIFARQFQPERIFDDGFESGDVSAWSFSSTDGGDLMVSPTAAQGGTSAGLLGLVDDTAGLFVEDQTPDDETRYRVRFHIDPNGFDPGEALNHRRTRVFIAFTEAPTRRVAALVLRRLGGAYALMGRARLDDDTQADTGFFTISDEPHVVELDLKPATGPGALDGSLEIRIDGASQALLENLDNSLGRVDFARLGALSVKTGAGGTLYWDEFESWRTTFPAP